MMARGKRLVSSLAGAAVAASLVAWVEARHAVPDPAHGPSLGAVFTGEIGVLLPFALGLGFLVGAACLFLEPARPRAPQEYLAALRAQPMLTRARTAALLPLAVLSTFAWCIVSAHVARRLLASGEPLVVGTELALTSVAVGAFAFAGALALVLPLRRLLASCAGRSARFVDPVSTGALACGVVVVLTVTGVAAGDVAGNGGGLLGILGVLKRPELDLGPVANLVAIALSAYLAPAALATLPSLATFVLALATLAPLAVTMHEARALNHDFPTVRAVEHAALGGRAIALLRRLTDRDKDGASPTSAAATATTTTRAATRTRSTSPATASTRTARARTSRSPPSPRSSSVPRPRPASSSTRR